MRMCRSPVSLSARMCLSECAPACLFAAVLYHLPLESFWGLGRVNLCACVQATLLPSHMRLHMHILVCQPSAVQAAAIACTLKLLPSAADVPEHALYRKRHLYKGTQTVFTIGTTQVHPEQYHLGSCALLSPPCKVSHAAACQAPARSLSGLRQLPMCLVDDC